MKVKYPRTFHLPWSEGYTSDDKVLKNIDHFIGKKVVVTENMDGENSTLYRDGLHARSIDSRHHPSRDWLKQFHSTISYRIPDECRVCGENLFAKHSIGYDSLDSYFLGFSLWSGDSCLEWNFTKEFFLDIGITPVPELYVGIFDELTIRSIQQDYSKAEGYVVRLADSFQYKDFGSSVAKFVRQNHVTSDEHWMHSTIIPNGVKI